MRVAMKKYIMKSGVAVLVLFAAVSIQAASINYGDFVGSTVTYQQVTESSLTDPVPLYGAPTVAGNSLDFNPVGFGATSNGGGVDLTDGQLVMDIQAHAGQNITQINFNELGTFDLIGSGTSNSYVQVSAFFVIEIKEVNGVGITPVQDEFWMTFSPDADGKYELPSNSGSGQAWSGSISIDINDMLITNGLAANATKVSVNLDNKLVAQSESGSFTYIDKKDFDGFSITVIPEPSSIFLMGFGVFGLVVLKRRLRI